MAKVLIAGYGYLGGRLSTKLLAAGHQVYGLRRRTADIAGSVVPVPADLSRRETLKTIPPELDFVVYMASAGQRVENAYRSTYVTGVQNLIAVLRDRGERLRRWLFVSSTAVYEEAKGDWVDEQTLVRPSAFPGRLLFEGEALSTGSGWPATIVRLSGIYGPGRARRLEQIRAGKPIPVASGRVSNLIHVEDAAGALAYLMECDGQPLYVGVDHQPVETRELILWLSRELKAPEPAFVEASSARFNKRCRNRRLLESGYQFRFPTFREGYRAILSS